MAETVLAMTTLNPDGAAALDTYLRVVGPLMERAGATLVQRYAVAAPLSGGGFPQFVSIMEYPDADAVARVFDHPDYLALKPVIATAFSRYDVCVLS
ncbi:DUF1330 domain-containing protein [Roseicyclus persicicus]|uniref:DUF1330 domain-containing protein n=1 Tax=Roseicyclus persicicus TaxID=2650661 RepID=A0A7X6GYE0_9RHOB|nr:DUF1330 domain-containing protein [Roseibacterium persicicum]NKX43417.1 DUF1330 domain-containing protein [Roseibacterium persicicum]